MEMANGTLHVKQRRPHEVALEGTPGVRRRGGTEALRFPPSPFWSRRGPGDAGPGRVAAGRRGDVPAAVGKWGEARVKARHTYLCFMYQAMVPRGKSKGAGL